MIFRHPSRYLALHNVMMMMIMMMITFVIMQVNTLDLMNSSRLVMTMEKRLPFSSSRTSLDIDDWFILEME